MACVRTVFIVVDVILGFLVGMTLVSLVVLKEAVSSAITANMTEEDAKVALRPKTLLSQQTEYAQTQFQHMQYMFKCCGFLNGTHDWGAIPDTCLCLDETTSPNQTSPHCITEYVMWHGMNTSEEIQVYEQPCFPYLFRLMGIFFKTIAAFQFIFLLCLIVGPIMALAVLYQMRRKTVTQYDTSVKFTAHSSDSKDDELQWAS
ncbi:hypothetical protein ACEWY4_002014 [Coilia grayii]|uniref:Uncharacterized protein n=1 Tax=Coilia grayii TaxID=363190 RepID=A0ABD1KV17_9TELE